MFSFLCVYKTWYAICLFLCVDKYYLSSCLIYSYICHNHIFVIIIVFARSYQWRLSIGMLRTGRMLVSLVAAKGILWQEVLIWLSRRLICFPQGKKQYKHLQISKCNYCATEGCGKDEHCFSSEIYFQFIYYLNMSWIISCSYF